MKVPRGHCIDYRTNGDNTLSCCWRMDSTWSGKWRDVGLCCDELMSCPPATLRVEVKHTWNAPSSSRYNHPPDFSRWEETTTVCRSCLDAGLFLPNSMRCFLEKERPQHCGDKGRLWIEGSTTGFCTRPPVHDNKPNVVTDNRVPFTPSTWPVSAFLRRCIQTNTLLTYNPH